MLKSSDLNGSGSGNPTTPSLLVPVEGPIFGIALSDDDVTLAVASGSQVLLFDLVGISQRV